MSKGETLELDDGSFLKITSFGKLENSQAVKIFGHLLRRIKEFQDSLPVTFGGSELVWFREAKKHGGDGPGARRLFRVRHQQECSPHPEFNPPNISFCFRVGSPV